MIAIAFGIAGLAIALLMVFSLQFFTLPDVDYIPDDSPRMLGNSREGSVPGAPVEIEVFEDFRCPHCATMSDTLMRVIIVYGSEVNVLIRQYPMMDGGFLAAMAVECARDQGFFWTYRDRLFMDQDRLDPRSLLNYADELGMDIARFAICLDSREKAGVVESDIIYGQELLVRGTPTVFINGRKIEGDQEYGVFKRMIDEEKRNAAG